MCAYIYFRAFHDDKALAFPRDRDAASAAEFFSPVYLSWSGWCRRRLPLCTRRESLRAPLSSRSTRITRRRFRPEPPSLARFLIRRIFIYTRFAFTCVLYSVCIRNPFLHFLYSCTVLYFSPVFPLCTLNNAVESVTVPEIIPKPFLFISLSLALSFSLIIKIDNPAAPLRWIHTTGRVITAANGHQYNFFIWTNI